MAEHTCHWPGCTAERDRQLAEAREAWDDVLRSFCVELELHEEVEQMDRALAEPGEKP